MNSSFMENGKGNYKGTGIEFEWEIYHVNDRGETWYELYINGVNETDGYTIAELKEYISEL